jgi:hypothetical protein
VGLHNPNDWRYHQKPGNLFNTYLGKAPPPDPPETRRRRPSQGPHGKSELRDAVEALVRFLLHNASVDEANQFLSLTARSKGQAISHSREPWSSIRAFAREHLTTDEVERYLAELRRRKSAREPLIQATMLADLNWSNKERLPDRLLRDLIEHFSKLSLANRTAAPDVIGNAYEYLIKRFADLSKKKAGEFYNPAFGPSAEVGVSRSDASGSSR